MVMDMERRAILKSLGTLAVVSAGLVLTRGRASAASPALATIDDVDRVLREGTAHLRTPESPPGVGVAPDGFVLFQVVYPSLGEGAYNVYHPENGKRQAVAWLDFWLSKDDSMVVRSTFNVTIVIEREGRPAMEVEIDPALQVPNPNPADGADLYLIREELHPAIAPIAAELKRRLLALGPIAVEQWEL